MGRGIVTKKRKRQGHYCWSCDRHRANEKFSGKNHPRHLCKDCARLGKEVLAIGEPGDDA